MEITEPEKKRADSLVIVDFEKLAEAKTWLNKYAPNIRIPISASFIQLVHGFGELGYQPPSDFYPYLFIVCCKYFGENRLLFDEYISKGEGPYLLGASQGTTLATTLVAELGLPGSPVSMEFESLPTTNEDAAIGYKKIGVTLKGLIKKVRSINKYERQKRI